MEILVGGVEGDRGQTAMPTALLLLHRGMGIVGRWRKKSSSGGGIDAGWLLMMNAAAVVKEIGPWALVVALPWRHGSGVVMEG